jgi:Spy/CpxP family protein refolding chaperone
MKTIVSAVFFTALSFVMMPTSSAAPWPDADEQRGCCSRHGGVCGCSSHHTTCCDGSTSPSCHCRVE